MSFYVVLPNNASKNEFSNNTSNSYKVRLPSPLGLQGLWEVGLASISLPDAVPTVRGLMDAQDDTDVCVGELQHGEQSNCNAIPDVPFLCL